MLVQTFTLLPMAYAQTVTMNENTAKVLTLTGTETGGDTLTFAVVTLPAHGSLKGSGPSLTYTPAANFHGLDSLGFIAFDGTNSSVPAAILITVNDVTVPVAYGKSVSVSENSSFGLTLTGTDSDHSDGLTFTVVT